MPSFRSVASLMKSGFVRRGKVDPKEKPVKVKAKKKAVKKAKK